LKKKPSQKMAGGVAQGEDPEFKPQYYKKKERKEKSFLISYFGAGLPCSENNHLEGPQMQGR
jgi:hypothetical protein